MIRLGLFLYDHLGGRRTCRRRAALDLRPTRPVSRCRPALPRGFEYSDCWVEDARLVVLNARDAAERGAEILHAHALHRAPARATLWRRLEDVASGETEVRRARWSMPRARGSRRFWTAASGSNAPAQVRLVKGSHIVVPRLYDHDRCLHLPERRRPHRLRHSLRAAISR